jgi:predicted MPP superfamily phosphohydrolase
MLLVEQKLLIFPENLSSILVFSWALYWGRNSKKKKKKKQQRKKKKKLQKQNVAFISGN